MSKEELKKKIIAGLVVEDEKSWGLAKEIFQENSNRLKPGVSVETIYNRIRELKSEVR